MPRSMLRPRATWSGPRVVRVFPTSRQIRSRRLGSRAPARARSPSTGARQHTTGSRFDESVPNRIAGQLDAVAHAELLEDVRAVAIDRLLADHQGLGDLPVGIALGHELDDFGLP